MKIAYEPRFRSDYAGLPAGIQQRFDKQLRLFLENPRHPSLRIKKMEGFNDIWEGRITQNYRFTFRIVDQTCVLRRIGTHNVLKTP